MNYFGRRAWRKKDKGKGDGNCLKMDTEGNWNPSKEDGEKTGKW